MAATPEVARMSVAEIAKLDPRPDGRAFLAMVPHGWARDTDPVKALTEAVKHGAYFPKEPFGILIDVPADAQVDGMGSVRWQDGSVPIETLAEVPFTKSDCTACDGYGEYELPKPELDEHGDETWIRLCEKCDHRGWFLT